ncbi:uncharacterized protein AMSG_07865 [Thecamonas trahens ATCC 50062]|uniref:Uncharacterized protein n=1 Tax=Thecamonas trahens ATCC 50062 TaxID=461836 RepID=A0A0L0DHT7_THETB|nr:hypothetical protein AMSG_07865 [Thecamonas trahens ATCC 50062]KNC51790.1 hypothetical protein AMSG_07865 [Thecamonas trahens ATCC 50062]|eukprot:XP_013755661.1 hypothetical protein AMSG_07865 [Thecamonas trahens ATCC 50062]
MADKLGWVEDKLRQLREAYHIEFRGFLTNHASHGVAVLAAMFPDNPAAVDAYLATYVRRLESAGGPIEQGQVAHIGDELEKLWVPGSAGSLCGGLDNDAKIFAPGVPFNAASEAMTGVLARHGLADTVFTCLAAVVDGIHSAAFHPLIQLGLALDIDSRGMIAEALAYNLGAHDKLLPEGTTPELEKAPVASPEPLALAETVRQLASVLEAPGEDAGGFQDRVRALRLQPRDAAALAGIHKWFRDAAGAWGASLGGIAMLLVDTALVLYHATHHEFFVLHAVTSAHALRALVELAERDEAGPDRTELLVNAAAGWFTAAVAVVSVEAPRWNATRVAELSGASSSGDALGQLEELVGAMTAAGAAPDEHALKLVYVVWRARGAAADGCSLLSQGAREAVACDLAQATARSFRSTAGRRSTWC